MKEGGKEKWYFSYPVLIITFILFWPVSLVLAIIRFRKRAEQEGKYKSRSKIALGVELAIITISILLVMIASYKDSSWKKQFSQYMQEENFIEANQVLAEHSKTAVYKKNMEYYLDLWEKSEDYSDAEQIIEKYYNTLDDPARFDEAVENRIKTAEGKFSPEQKEKIVSILDKVSEARRAKESQEMAEKKSKAEEELRKAAEEESKRDAVAQAEAQKKAEKEAQEASKAEQESQKEAEKEAQKASKAEEESRKAAEQESQKESKAQEEMKKAEEKKQQQSQAAAEKEQKEMEEAQVRIEENIEAYINKPDSKKLKKLQKEDPDWVKSALKEKLHEAGQAIEQEETAFDNIEDYCALYENLYGAEDIQDIRNVTQEIKSLKHKSEILDHITVAGKTFSIEDAYNNMCESRDFYVTQRLETKYDNTIAGAVQQGLDSLNQPEGSEWVVYNVKYEAFGTYPGDDCAVVCTSQQDPFSQSGVYHIAYIASSDTRRLKDSQGFTSNVPVYYMVDDIDALYKRYNQSEERRTEIYQKLDRLKLILSMQ